MKHSWHEFCIAIVFLAIVIGAVMSCRGPHRIEEDEPGWNCATMGNKVCGMLDAETPNHVER